MIATTTSNSIKVKRRQLRRRSRPVTRPIVENSHIDQLYIKLSLKVNELRRNVKSKLIMTKLQAAAKTVIEAENGSLHLHIDFITQP